MSRIRKAAAIVVVAVLAGANVTTQLRYLSQSLDSGRGTAAMVAEFSRLVAVPPANPVLLDIAVPGYPNLVALYSRGRPTIDLSGSPLFGFQPYVIRVRSQSTSAIASAFRPIGMPELMELAIRTADVYQPAVFAARDGLAVTHHFRQSPSPPDSPSSPFLVAPAGDAGIVNASSERPATGRYYLTTLAQAHNHLVLLDSDVAHVIIPGVYENVAMWQREPDFADPARGAQEIGRHLLFEVLNPVAGSQLLLDFTTASLGAEGAALRRATVVGEERATIGLAGNGASRLLAPPVTPRLIGGRAYVAIDMGADTTQFGSSRNGMAGLFNRSLRLDPRRLTGFARNISLVTPEQVRAMCAPSAIRSFPGDLFAPGLLFTGVYEDGWMAETSRFRLQVADGSRGLAVAGSVLGFGAMRSGVGIALLVDGEPVLRRRLELGDFELHAELPRSSDARWIEIRAEAVDRLPGRDGRIASILLRSIALEP